MLVEDIKKEALRIYRFFLSELGFNGKTFPINTDFAVVFEEIGDDLGLFFKAGSNEVEEYLERLKNDLTEDEIKTISNSGLIKINKEYLDSGDVGKIVRIYMHEMIHGNRTVLTNKAVSKNKDFDPVVYIDGKFIDNTTLYESAVENISDIVWESVDTSEKAKEELKRFNEGDGFYYSEEHENQLEFQENVDEALTELMSYSAYRCYYYGENIIDSIKKFKTYKNKNIRSIVNIIDRHNDLELFKWMIIPLEYQGYDLSYNFFKEYVNADDLEDVLALYDGNSTMVDKYIKTKKRH